MEFVLQKDLPHQEKAVKAVADVFESIDVIAPQRMHENPVFSFKDCAGTLEQNIKSVQASGNVAQTDRSFVPADENGMLPLDIKMETGTGKTYVYTKTMFELHKRYHINKFIIIVPTLPIKSGAKQFISSLAAKRHFRDECGYEAEIELSVLEKQTQKAKQRSSFPSSVKNFLHDTFQDGKKIYVLLTNMQLLEGASKILSKEYDQSFLDYSVPFDAIRSVHPFVMIDEPHRFKNENKAYQTIVSEIQPQCLIRYGATFPEIQTGKGKNKETRKDYKNLLYDLTAKDAFNFNLIKGVAKDHIGSQQNLLIITETARGSSVSFCYQNRTITLGVGDSLGLISPNLGYLTVNGITDTSVILSDGTEKHKKEKIDVNTFAENYQEQMIRLALLRHFETEKINFNRFVKMKTLSLFFIEDIASFQVREDNPEPWLKKMFDRLLREKLEQEIENKTNTPEYRAYLKESFEALPKCRGEYFANHNTEEEIQEQVDEILKDKSALLDLKNPRRFIFSKWALREGWDNPNVFTICKLRSSGSEISKLQEVGRGLRLPVDANGNRVSDESFTLNYIVDASEQDFAEKLVKEINGDQHAVVSMIDDAELQRVAQKRNMDADALFIELFQNGFIKRTMEINPEKRNDFLSAYPEFDTKGVKGGKITDRGEYKADNPSRNEAPIRPERFNELRELWEKLNQGCFLFYQEEVNEKIKEAIPELFSNGVFTENVLHAVRQRVATEDETAAVQTVEERDFVLNNGGMPYNAFLKRLEAVTGLPLTTLHKGLCEYAKKNGTPLASHFNEKTISNFKQRFEEWKIKNLLNLVKYEKRNITVRETALTDNNGNVKAAVSPLASVGIKTLPIEPNSAYLYDTAAFDSDIEREDILGQINNVVVYGKIPRRSVAIPVFDGTYSPDFMYIIKRKDGKTNLNLVVEAKNVGNEGNLREDEAIKIKFAEKFFEALNDGKLDIVFKKQLHNEEMATIIRDLLKEGK